MTVILLAACGSGGTEAVPVPRLEEARPQPQAATVMLQSTSDANQRTIR